MNHVVSNPLRLSLLVLIILLFAACSSTPAPTNSSFDYVASVKLNEADSKTAIEAAYGGKAFIFDKEAGFAMLGFSKEAAELSTLTTETNIDRFSSPVNAAGFSAWAGGFSAWAGGFSAWAGGWSAWAGGTPVPAPVENNNIWNQINLPQAHAITRNFGSGVTVAVIDTGVDVNHSVFSGRLAPSSMWRDYVDNDNLPQEGSSSGQGYGHGTAVAGLILQVAPKATILPLRVLDSDGQGDLDDVILAVLYAVNSGAKVINLSLGATDYSWSLVLAIQYARANGVYVVASSGNFGSVNSTTYPAQNAYWDQVHPFLISAGSVDNNNNLSSFTSYGSGLTINAPAEKNYSTFPGNQIGYFKGTSFAAPLVSGALALGYADAPAAAKTQLFDALTKGGYSSGDYWDRNSGKYSQGSIGEGVLNVANFLRSIPGWTEPSTSKYKTSTSLFPNGGFESALSSGWWLNSASRSTVRQSGSYGLQVNPWGSAGIWLTGLKPNTTYTLVGWGKTTNADEPVQIGVSDYGGINFNQNFWFSDYTSKAVTFKTGSTYTSASIYVSTLNATGYVDNIVLIEDK